MKWETLFPILMCYVCLALLGFVLMSFEPMFFVLGIGSLLSIAIIMIVWNIKEGLN